MRVKEVISRIQIKLKTLNLQNSSSYFTDEEILAFINDAQNDIIIRHYPVEGKHTINITNRNVLEYQLPDYVGKVRKVFDNKDNIYKFVSYESLIEQKQTFTYSLLNNLLSFGSPLPAGVNLIYVYFDYSKAPQKANLISQDLFIPHYYDKAIEYYVLSQLTNGDQSVFFINLYQKELSEKSGVFYSRTESNKIEGSW